MSKRETTAGERVAAQFVGPHPTLARKIDRAIRAAVKAERARCVGVVEELAKENPRSPITRVACDDIIKRMKGGE